MVNERRNRIPRPWLWVLAGAALVGVLAFVFFVVAVAPSLLIEPLPRGLSAADELKARNDVRTTLVQALAGLAVAGGLVVTYRTYRQNRAEQDRTYERELYAKAVEQLGHEKAPVRLGALYSLERLAEDKPERRQIIVNVICAYLRMPFSPTPPASKPEPEATEAPDARAADTGTRTAALGDTWWQERQVRLTAQQILSEHLRDDRAEDKRSTDPTSLRFWPGIRLDLAGATLIDFDLHNGVMADANFRRATFTGDPWFAGAEFTDSAEFGGATFTGAANFVGATFAGIAGFDGATFAGRPNFGGATFTGNTWFNEAIFTGGASFSLAAFTAGASFRKATFVGDALFTAVKFSRAAEFVEAIFTGAAWFIGAAFTGAAEFGGAAFAGGESSLSFELSRVVSREAAHIWPTGWRLAAVGSSEYTVVRADDGLDNGLKLEEPPAAGTARGA